ncbi:putative leucine-rich repeat receptor-like serine/threonine-protein kinase At2g04300 [Tripterygium wilfordii]|uniref:putative leucine-rich repeat receptor-like serine/threonine-protein kinase At2g04300 n=1 Tax=Tripterygium wilfordii TaxID=458696 RepID=UPI0018F7E7FD|nr:putative leucine-rich repeat receptor-like serine/threonine-protein kinase At2g04300 [Tripterygium wilfordii]
MDMKEISYHQSWKLVVFCIISTFFNHAFSGSCVLNFTYPYQPTGVCIGGQKKFTIWDGIETTICCQNVLDTITKALAFRAHNAANGTIFMEENLWRDCTGPFASQNTVSADACGFGDLTFNQSIGCSSFSLADIQRELSYKEALESCSNFNTSFVDECKKCAGSLLRARDRLLEQFAPNVQDDHQRRMCGIAIVVSVAAAKYNDRNLIDDFYRCLPIFDDFDSGYIRIRYSVVKALFAIVIALVTVTLVLLLVKYMTKRKPLNTVVQSNNDAGCSSLYRFSKTEIENAINHGNERKVLGKGSAGQVYKGVLPSGQEVAIKQIHNSTKFDTFTREVDGLLRVRHPNLVCLFGCCIEGSKHYLVYEYCSAGNLAQNLLRKDNVLTWERRVKIMRGCALGLRYLHHYIDGCIVHRDIKLTNILLTENLEPKLSDFGLAKMLGMEESKVFTDVRGTIGYMDPEYMTNAKLTCASDIYSFGIVILQLLSGQKVIELDLDARDQLTRKAKDASLGRRPLSDFEDPRLNGNVNKADFESILEIAVLCVARSSKGRPTMDVVFDELDKAWKNTAAEMGNNMEMDSSVASMSASLEVVSV